MKSEAAWRHVFFRDERDSRGLGDGVGGWGRGLGAGVGVEYGVWSVGVGMVAGWWVELGVEDINIVSDIPSLIPGRGLVRVE